MKISQLELLLASLKAFHGDIEVYVMDDVATFDADFHIIHMDDDGEDALYMEVERPNNY